MTPKFKKYIDDDPDRAEIPVVVRRSRTPVSDLLAEFAQALDIDQFLTAHPDVSREEVRACLDCAAAAMRRVERFHAALKGTGTKPLKA